MPSETVMPPNRRALARPAARDEQNRRLVVLVPFDKREAISVATAAEIAARSEETIRAWCLRHHIGRHFVDGGWLVSKPALYMLMEGDTAALKAYLAGDRTGPLVLPYFRRFGIRPPTFEPSGRLVEETSQ